MASSGFSQIRLYQNTTSSIPVGVYTDVTNDFLSTADSSTVIEDELYDYDGCNKTVSGLSPGTQYYFWVECIDEAGNSSGIQSLGSITTASSGPSSIAGNGTPLPVGTVVTASSNNDASRDPSYVFDGLFHYNDNQPNGGEWHSGFDRSAPHWLKIQFQQAYTITTYRIWSGQNGTPTWAPAYYQFQGSNDGTSWTTLDSRTNSPPPSWTGGDAGAVTAYVENAVASPGSYTQYRLYINGTPQENSLSAYAIIGEIELFT